MKNESQLGPTGDEPDSSSSNHIACDPRQAPAHCTPDCYSPAAPQRPARCAKLFRPVRPLLKATRDIQPPSSNGGRTHAVSSGERRLAAAVDGRWRRQHRLHSRTATNDKRRGENLGLVSGCWVHVPVHSPLKPRSKLLKMKEFISAKIYIRHILGLCTYL